MQDRETVQIISDLDALSKLFEANQELAHAERALESAKEKHKQAKAYRNTMLDYIDAYTVHRREEQARRSLLENGFRQGPDWFKPGQDPDKPTAQ